MVSVRPKLSYPQGLPILEKKDQIVRALRNYQVIVVSGDTGCGKSTQLPKMCLEAGRGIEGKIGCTQPRRIAAVTIGHRIADELGEEVGHSVGYKIRFVDRTNPAGYIKILTDGMLLAETQQDRFLREYDTLIIDEAHERSLNIDFVLGILKTLLAKRRDLKVIITSATIDTEKFSQSFDRAPVIEVEGRMYPVKVEYMPPEAEADHGEEVTYVDRAVEAVNRLKVEGRSGDILVFMPTEQDIMETCERLEGRRFPGTTIFPLFARLPGSRQRKVFSPCEGQKIVVATNVAETSLTIPGIKYVVDTGLARIPRYVARTRTTTLPVSPISKSSADQRKGRCGRVKDGICIRLYSEEDYESRPVFSPPEILRSNLAEVILRMLSLDLGDVWTFPFVDSPNERSVRDGFNLLMELGAIVDRDGDVRLTEQGRIMARIPMDPRISRMILEAKEEGCVQEVAVIASALSIQDPRERPPEKVSQADEVHSAFLDSDSDFLTLLNIWNRCSKLWEFHHSWKETRKFCKKNFLSFVRIREWRDIYHQISSILREEGIEITRTDSSIDAKSRYASIHRSILSGYLSNIGVKQDKNIYLAPRGREAMIFPGSTLYNKGARWIVAAEMVKTSRLFARTAARINRKWVESVAGDLLKREFLSPYWDKSRGEVRALERVSLFGLVIVHGRSVPYGPIKPEEAHKIFVRSALVEGDLKEDFAFLKHNQDLVKKIENMENRLRRRGILAGEEAREAFYSKRLPGVYDIPTLRNRIKERGGEDFLKMREEDLLLSSPDEAELALYPEWLSIGGRKFECSYRFAPGKEDDGVTINIPQSLASWFPVRRLQWLVPGLLREKVEALIKRLPKHYRKQLVPVSETSEIIASDMEDTGESLISSLSSWIYRRFGVDIPASEWSESEIPDYLRMRVSIQDYQGKEIKSTRDVHLLNQEKSVLGEGEAESEPESLVQARKEWERTGISRWDFGDLPESITIQDHLVVYPCLEPSEGGVNIRLVGNSAKASKIHQKGVEALFCLLLKKELKFVKRTLRLPEEAAQGAAYFGGPGEVEKAVYNSLLTRLFHLDLRSQEDFHSRLDSVRGEITSKAKELMELVGSVLVAYSRLQDSLQAIEKGALASRAVLVILQEIREDLNRLVPGEFIKLYPVDRLHHIPRYLNAMATRAERGANDPRKDQKKAEQVYDLKQALERMVGDEQLSLASREKQDAVEDYRWMVEEFKVSVFAQELKTAFPVSRKRLEEKVAEIERMV